MTTSAASARRLDPRERLTSGGIVLGAIVSVQVGAAVVTTLFDDLKPQGAVLLRSLFGALALLALGAREGAMTIWEAVHDDALTLAPEDARRLAKESGRELREVIRLVAEAARRA